MRKLLSRYDYERSIDVVFVASSAKRSHSQSKWEQRPAMFRTKASSSFTDQVQMLTMLSSVSIKSLKMPKTTKSSAAM